MDLQPEFSVILSLVTERAAMFYYARPKATVSAASVNYGGFMLLEAILLACEGRDAVAQAFGKRSTLHRLSADGFSRTIGA